MQLAGDACRSYEEAGPAVVVKGTLRSSEENII